MSNIIKKNFWWLLSGGGGVPETPFKFIAYGDSHVAKDKTNGRDSLGKMFTDYIDDELDHEIGIGYGDYGANDAGDRAADDAEGPEIITQYAEAPYERAYYYQNLGNHDAGTDSGYAWWRKWIDPAGETPASSTVINANRPYPIQQIGSIPLYLAYYIEVGNLLIVLMGDNNEAATTQAGRGETPAGSGYPAGGLSDDEWNEVVSLLVKNSNRPIILFGHQAVRDTTGVSSFGDPVKMNVHGADPDNPGGEGYIYAIGTDLNTNKFHYLFSQFQGMVDMYMHGHTHLKLVNNWGGKGLVRECYGMTFVNGGALTKYWVNFVGQSDPQSNYCTVDGTNLKIQKFAHESDNVLSAPVGIVDSLEQNITLKTAFSRNYSAPSISAPSTQPTSFVADRGTTTSIRLRWTGNDAKYLVIQRSGAAPTGAPSNGSVYQVGDTIGDGSVAFMGNLTEVELHGLSNGTTYHWAVFAFNSGGNDIKYNTTSPLTGSHTIAASSLSLYDEVPFNIINLNKWTVTAETTAVEDQAFMLADDGKIWAHSEGLQTTGTIANLANAWTSIKSAASGLATVVFTFTKGAGTPTSNNITVTCGIFNNNSASAKGARDVARIIYGPADNLRCQYRTANTERNAVTLGSSVGTLIFKITVNHTGGVVNFYQWNGSSWTLIAGPFSHATSILAPGTDLKAYIAFQASSGDDGLQDVYYEDIYLSTADIAGLTP